MIAILGSRKDDLLYLCEYADELSEEMVLPCGGKYQIGKIGGVEVILGNAGESNFLSAIYLSELFALYPLPTVIKLGDGVALDPEAELGDVIYVDAVYPHGVNYHADGYRYGEIPEGIPSLFPLNREFLPLLEESGFKIRHGNMMSGEKAIYEKGEFETILKRRFLYLDKGMGIYDTCGYGVALTCHLHQANLVMLMSASFILGDEEGKVNMRKVALTNQVTLGRMVARILEGGAL